MLPPSVTGVLLQARPPGRSVLTLRLGSPAPRRGSLPVWPRTLFDVRVAVTGSHGLIGTALVARLRADGHDPVRMVRAAPGTGEIGWDPHAGRLDPRALADVDAVVNLAGAGIGDKRWTDEYKRQVVESRTRATTLVSEAMAALEPGPGVLLSGSAIGFYGDRGDEELDERSPGRQRVPDRGRGGVGGQHGGGRAQPAAVSSTCAPASCWPRRAVRSASCCRCSRSGSAVGSGPAGSG